MAYDLKHLRISNSSIMLFRSCARKFEFRKIYEQGGYEATLPGDAGTALHNGYQSWFIHRDKELAIQKFMLSFPWSMNDSPTWNRSAEACYYTLEQMMNCGLYQQYEIATVMDADGVLQPAVEVPFEINIKGFSLSDNEEITVSYIGFIDLILYDKFENKYVVVDVKTHRDNTPDLTPKFVNDEQCLPYAMVLERALGLPIIDLDVHYMSCYIDIKTPVIRDYHFIKSKDAVNDWARHLLVDLQQIKIFYNLQWFPRHGGGCVFWYKPCSFIDFCHERKVGTLEQMLKADPFDAMRDKKPWLSLDLELAA